MCMIVRVCHIVALGIQCTEFFRLLAELTVFANVHVRRHMTVHVAVTILIIWSTDTVTPMDPQASKLYFLR